MVVLRESHYDILRLCSEGRIRNFYGHGSNPISHRKLASKTQKIYKKVDVLTSGRGGSVAGRRGPLMVSPRLSGQLVRRRVLSSYTIPAHAHHTPYTCDNKRAVRAKRKQIVNRVLNSQEFMSKQVRPHQTAAYL